MSALKNILVMGNSTPGILLRSLIDEEDKIKNMTVTIEYKDGSASAYWTAMSGSEILYLAALSSHEAKKVAFGE